MQERRKIVDSLSRALSDPARLAALSEMALLDSPAEEAFDRLTRLAARILRAPVALVSLVDADRQFFKSAVGLSGDLAITRETPLSHSYCKHVVDRGEPLIIEDAAAHPLLRDNPAVAEYNAIAYAGIPLATPQGHVLGSFCVVDNVPRRWTGEEIEILRDLAASVMAEIELRVAIRIIEQQRQEAEEQRREEEELRRAREAAEAALRQRAFLREVLLSATEGRLRVCESEKDLPAPLPVAAEPVALSEPALQDLRRQVLEVAAKHRFSPERGNDLMMAAGEASMNAVVHGKNGRGQVRASGDTVQVWITDTGKGIAFESLHRATLERGWTTAGSMGHGFWMMLQSCDRLYLLTGPVGTTTVVEQDRETPDDLLLAGWS